MIFDIRVKRLLFAGATMAMALAMTACGGASAGNGQDTQAQGEQLPEEEIPEIEVEEVDIINLKVEDHIDIGDYKTMEIAVLPKAQITDEMIDARIRDAVGVYGEYRERTADEPVESGDAVNIDFAGTKDKIAFDGGTAEDVDFTVGTGAFIPGFEEAIIGMKTGETKEVPLTFPEDYKAPSLAGEDVIFTITLNSARAFDTPEFNDEFVAGLGIDNVTTVAEYRDYLRKAMEAEEEDTYEARVENAITNALSDVMIVKSYPKWLVEHYVSNIKSFQDGLAEMSGYSPEEYAAQFYNVTYADFQNLIRTAARSNTADAMMMKAVTDAEGITVTAKEVDDFIAESVENGGFQSEASMMEYLGRNRVDFEVMMLQQRSYGVIRQTLTIKDAVETERSKPTEVGKEPAPSEEKSPEDNATPNDSQPEKAEETKPEPEIKATEAAEPETTKPEVAEPETTEAEATDAGVKEPEKEEIKTQEPDTAKTGNTENDKTETDKAQTGKTQTPKTGASNKANTNTNKATAKPAVAKPAAKAASPK